MLCHRFWLAVEDLKKRPIREVPARVQEIWQEFLAPGAPSAINLDSKSYDKTTQNVKEPGRYTFEDAQEHIYKLMKSDSYPRFIRSSAYQELLQAKKKVLVHLAFVLPLCKAVVMFATILSLLSPVPVQLDIW